MSELATSHLSAAVPLEIERLRDRGGPTESDVLWAQEKMQVVRNGAGGHAIVFLDKGQTAKETSLLTEVLAILAFQVGGVRFAGLHFDATQQTFGLALDDAFFAEMEPFRAAMDRIERESRRLEDVTPEERARLREIEVLLMQAADAGDSTQVALLEAEMDAILLKPQPVVVEPIQAVQRELWDESA
jgi:CheY-like chemotaxis protein